MEESWVVGRVCCRDVSAERNRRIPRNFGWDVYMSCVLCMRAEKEWEWADVGVGGQVTEVFSFSAELRLRVPTLKVRGVVTAFAFLTGRGREGLVWHASCRREKAGWDAKLSIPQRGQLI